MDHCLLSALEQAFKKCSDCLLQPEYTALLNQLDNIELTQELVNYLCAKATSTKHIWEIRFIHLRILLCNPSSYKFDLREFYLENIKKCRRLAMKVFFIRGYAIYASEEELNPIMEKFQKNLEKNHDYIDYNYILSIAGLPYLVHTYGYTCFTETLKKAEQEYQNIDPLLRGYFTINSHLEQVNLLPLEEIHKQSQLFLDKCQKQH